MVPRDKAGKKSNKQIKQEILEDWADVRRWIDELQQDWSERSGKARPSKENLLPPKKLRTSSCNSSVSGKPINFPFSVKTPTSS